MKRLRSILLLVLICLFKFFTRYVATTYHPISSRG